MVLTISNCTLIDGTGSQPVKHQDLRIENNKIVEVNKKIKKERAAGNFIGMAKFSKNASKKLFYEIDNLIKEKKDGYYTTGIENLIKKKLEVGYQTTDNLLWMDIDDEIEFKESHKIFRGTGDF